MRASNAVYEVPEGREVWKARPLQMLVTLVILTLVALTLSALIVSGPVAEAIGQAIGLGSVAVTVYGIAKWPIMALLVITILAILYYSAPKREAPQVRLDNAGQRLRSGRLGHRLGRIRLLRRQLRLLQQDLRGTRRRRRVPGVAVDDEHRGAARAGDERGARAHPRAQGRNAGGRAADPARAAGRAHGQADSRHRPRGSSRPTEERRRADS